MAFPPWKGTEMFATKPGSRLQCLQIREESKASRCQGYGTERHPGGHPWSSATRQLFACPVEPCAFLGALFLSNELLRETVCVERDQV